MNLEHNLSYANVQKYHHSFHLTYIYSVTSTYAKYLRRPFVLMYRICMRKELIFYRGNSPILKFLCEQRLDFHLPIRYSLQYPLHDIATQYLAPTEYSNGVCVCNYNHVLLNTKHMLRSSVIYQKKSPRVSCEC